jgi:hypothetical protein
MKLKSQPEDDGSISGTEPWDLPSLFKAIEHKPANADMLGCVDKLRLQGGHVLTTDEQAFWLSYQEAAKSPLAPPGNVAIDLEQQHVDNATKAFSEAKPDAKELAATLDQTANCLVSRHGNIGLFAKRGPIRSLSLPGWCVAAVCVNTKAAYWEVITPSHHKLLQLPLLVTGVSPGDWSGHRYRVRHSGLPDIRSIHMMMYSLAVNSR